MSRFVFGFVAVACAVTLSAFGQNRVVFDNRSGDPALVKLIGPTKAEVQVPNGAKTAVDAAMGKYTIKVRYGMPGNYLYTKGQEFEVTETATARSETTITLHKVTSGNYDANPISEAEFGNSEPQKGIPQAMPIQAGSNQTVNWPEDSTYIMWYVTTNGWAERTKLLRQRDIPKENGGSDYFDMRAGNGHPLLQGAALLHGSKSVPLRDGLEQHEVFFYGRLMTETWLGTMPPGSDIGSARVRIVCASNGKSTYRVVAKQFNPAMIEKKEVALDEKTRPVWQGEAVIDVSGKIWQPVEFDLNTTVNTPSDVSKTEQLLAVFISVEGDSCAISTGLERKPEIPEQPEMGYLKWKGFAVAPTVETGMSRIRVVFE